MPSSARITEVEGDNSSEESVSVARSRISNRIRPVGRKVSQSRVEDSVWSHDEPISSISIDESARNETRHLNDRGSKSTRHLNDRGSK